MNKIRQDLWSDEETQLLKEKWALGVSATNIAKMTGRTIGAIMGQIDRMGLNREVRQTPSLRSF